MATPSRSMGGDQPLHLDVSPLAANRSADDPLLYTTPNHHVGQGYPNTDGVNNVLSANWVAAKRFMCESTAGGGTHNTRRGTAWHTARERTGAGNMRLAVRARRRTCPRQHRRVRPHLQREPATDRARMSEPGQRLPCNAIPATDRRHPASAHTCPRSRAAG